MVDDEKKIADEEKDKETKAPISEICADAKEAAEDLIDDDSEIKPVEGFFLTSQRWH